MIDLERNGEIFMLTMNDGENRWTTTFVRHFAAALDSVEASDGPAALVTTAASGLSGVSRWPGAECQGNRPRNRADERSWSGVGQTWECPSRRVRLRTGTRAVHGPI